MNVLFTLVVFVVIAAWALMIYRRLVSLRNQVKLAWKRLEADQSNDAIKTVYNKHVAMTTPSATTRIRFGLAVMVIGWSGPGSFMLSALALGGRDRDAAIRRIFNERDGNIVSQ